MVGIRSGAVLIRHFHIESDGEPGRSYVTTVDIRYLLNTEQECQSLQSDVS
jgi:hypothetical protein